MWTGPTQFQVIRLLKVGPNELPEKQIEQVKRQAGLELVKLLIVTYKIMIKK